MPNATILSALADLEAKGELHAILLLVCEFLAKAGYGEPKILGRRMFHQKSVVSGAEILVEGTYAGKPHLIVVKYVRDASGLRQRNFDELYGVTERLGANLGILVSLRDSHETFMKHPSFQKRLKLLAGQRLAEALETHRIGVFAGGAPDHRKLAEVRENAHWNDAQLASRGFHA